MNTHKAVEQMPVELMQVCRARPDLRPVVEAIHQVLTVGRSARPLILALAGAAVILAAHGWAWGAPVAVLLVGLTFAEHHALMWLRCAWQAGEGGDVWRK